MRLHALLAKDYFALKMEGEGERWLLRAAGEAPHLREPWLDLADLYYHREDWHGVLWAVNRALAITQRPRTYISEAVAWGEHPWDLASLGYYYTGQLGKALEPPKRRRSWPLTSPGSRPISSSSRRPNRRGKGKGRRCASPEGMVYCGQNRNTRRGSPW